MGDMEYVLMFTVFALAAVAWGYILYRIIESHRVERYQIREQDRQVEVPNPLSVEFPFEKSDEPAPTEPPIPLDIEADSELLDLISRNQDS